MTSFFYLINKETAKDECVITILHNFIFLGAIHVKHNFKYLKNPTVKVCQIWCNYVYMYILYCGIFWWKLIYRNCFNEIFNTRVVSQGIPRFSPISTVLHMIISKQDFHICQIFHNYSTITLPSVLKPKYSLSTRNKCVYLLEASATSITIWRQVFPKNCYI
jgi:hypothetical protein